jgi:hypothetical protein
MGFRSRACGAVLGITLTSASAVYAETPTAALPTAAMKETARALMDEGHAKDSRGDHKGALESFLAADNLMHVPTTAMEVARQQIALGLLVDARDTILRVRRLPASAGEPRAFTAAREEAERVDEGLAPRIPALRISVTGASNAGSAKLTIDETPVPASILGVPFRVNPGRHVVSITEDDGGHAEATADVAEGDMKNVSLAIDRSGATRLAPEILADRASEGSPAPAETPPTPSNNPAQFWLRWGGAGVAVVGLGVGAVTGAISLSSGASAKKYCEGGQCPPPAWGELSTARSMATASNVAFVAAGLGLASFAASFLVGGPHGAPPSNTAARLKIWVGLGSAGAAGEF